MKQDNTIQPVQPQKQPLEGLPKMLNDVGLDRDMVKSLVKSAASEYIKDKIGGAHKPTSKGLMGRFFAELKGAWWVFPLIIGASGISLILIIVVWKIAMRLLA